MPDIVSLADVRAHLRYPATNTADDIAIQGFIAAADDVIRAECGEVVPRRCDEYHDGGNYVLYLRHRPVLEVVNVEEGWGWWNWELDYQQVNSVPAGALFAYSVDSPEIGAVSRRSAGNVPIPFVPGMKNIRVTYMAGRPMVPGAIRLAALELIAHWWQQSQQRSTVSSAGFTAYDAVEGERATRETETGMINMNVGVPFRILEMLRPYRHIPFMG